MNRRFEWWRAARELTEEAEMLYLATMKARDLGDAVRTSMFGDMAALYAWRARNYRFALLGTEPEEPLKCLNTSTTTPSPGS